MLNDLIKIWNWYEFIWAIIWDLGVISWCFIIGRFVTFLREYSKMKEHKEDNENA